MCNADIKNEIRNAGLRLWQIAEMFNNGMNDGNFSRKLRKEFTLEEKEQVRQIITTLQKGGEKT